MERQKEEIVNKLQLQNIADGSLPHNNNNSHKIVGGDTGVFDSWRYFSHNQRGSTSSSSCGSIDDIDSPTTPLIPDDIIPIDETNVRRLRSKSDGFEFQTEPFEVFPSLPDSVLEKMNLLGEGPRERLCDEELERRFTQLALAFAIDSKTITDRCERQKRYRDQTESNFHSEIDVLIEKVSKIRPLCVDAEKTELLTSVLAQVDNIVKASFHASISAERFGAVLQEERLSESVALMVNHVGLLKKQRDAARRHLQMTKRVLQETQSSDNLTSKMRLIQNGKHNITKRRASIHTIVQNENIKSPPESRKISRRTSELSFKASAVISRSSRPSRLELGVDLDKIKEGIVENGPLNLNTKELPEQLNHHHHHHTDNVNNNEDVEEEDEDDDDLQQAITIRNKKEGRLQSFTNCIKRKIDEVTNSGVLHELFCMGTLLCFSLSIITFGNILIELEYAKHNVTPTHSILGTFWSDILILLTNGRNENEERAATS